MVAPGPYAPCRTRPGAKDPRESQPLEPPIADRLGDVRGAHRRVAGEIGDRARHLEHPVIGARRQRQPRHRLRQQCRALGVRARNGRRPRAAAAARSRMRWRSTWRSRAALVAPADDAAGLGRRAVAGRHRATRQGLGRDCRHVDPEVDAIEQRARRSGPGSARSGRACSDSARSRARASRRGRDSSPRRAGTRPETCSAGRRARCGSRRLRAARAAPRARGGPTRAVRRGTARRGARARSRRAAGRCRRRPAPRRLAVWCGARNGRRPRPRTQKRPASEASAATSSASSSDKRRQQTGQALRQHRLAGSRRADHQQAVRAGGRDLERALGRRLAAHVGEVGVARGVASAASGAPAASGASGAWPVRCPHTASSVAAGWTTASRMQRRLAGAGRGQDERAAVAARGQRHRQRAADRAQRAGQRELAGELAARRARLRAAVRSRPGCPGRSAGRSGRSSSAGRPGRG